MVRALVFLRNYLNLTYLFNYWKWKILIYILFLNDLTRFILLNLNDDFYK